ncbi:MAG: type II and III secretion system protein, partial [Spirochaetales bacterium]|nr:type II and III secretion system protein [Spirochaetales bacterium]
MSFKNTNTYRYRDMEVDPDTGKVESTGVTREITSGLIINLNGWVSGDQMITMEVKATVSKRGADVSSGTGNPPPTSEKIISTHIRTASGKPVVIGGLLQKDRDLVIEKVPFLGDITVLGLLFRSEVSTITNTELVIYIVPYIEYT